jgi:hypothetical protein
MVTIGTVKVRDDTIIPADVDETLDYNFSSISGTWAGQGTGTFTGNMTKVKSFIVGDLGTTSTARSFNGYLGVNFSTTPNCFANPIGLTTSSNPLFIQGNSASSFTLYAPSSNNAGSACVLAITI